MLETFRVLYSNNYVPERGTALQFMHFAMEEVGLVGSQILANDYKAAGAKVASMLQMDMVWESLFSFLFSSSFVFCFFFHSLSNF